MQARALAAVSVVLALSWPFSSRGRPRPGRWWVASKSRYEGALLRPHDRRCRGGARLAVDRRIQIGPTNIVRAALLAGRVDLEPD